MISRGSELAEAATRFVGTKFRLHGRDPRTGVDCIGLLLCALRAVGVEASGPDGYALRNLAVDQHLDCVEGMQLSAVSGKCQTGDVLLFRLRAAQFHLGIVCSDGSLVHAHAGLGKVVLTPAPFAWPIEHHWRLSHR